MINFIYGRSGSGKTSYICQKAAKALSSGKRVFLIVPEQMAVDAEARMTELLGDAPTLSLEILNFKRLCNRIFREYGGISYSYITKSGKQLMMWRTLTELSSMLKSGIKTERGGVSKMLGAVNEFKAYGITPPALSRAADKLSEEADTSALTDKLYDLSLIYAAYMNLTKEAADDASDDLTKASELLAKHGFFSGAAVFLDAFNGFTPQELSIIAKIFAQAENVTVSMTLDAPPAMSEDPLFENQKSTANRLVRMARDHAGEVNEITLTENLRAKGADLRFLEASLWSLDITESGAYNESADSLRLIECQNQFAECEAVCVDIKRRVREGAAWRDFSIITRGVERYDGILDVTLEKYGIPHFISRRTDIKTKPLIKLILSSLTMLITNFRTPDVISYIKTGLCSITPDEISALENYAEAWKIRGASKWLSEFTMNPNGYTAEFTEKSADTLSLVNNIRARVMTPVSELHAALKVSSTAKEYCTALYEFLIKLEIPEKLQALAERSARLDPASAQEYEQLWGVLADALDELCAVMPDLEIDCSTFSELLRTIFDETDIGRIPCTVDEVSVGDASLIRGAGRHVYMIGANEGVFPLAPSADGIFSDSDRRLLFDVGVTLAGGADEKSADERFAFYRAAASASETLTVIWSSADLSGHGLKPSFAVSRIKALFPKLEVMDYSTASIESRLEGKANIMEFIAEADGTPLGEALRSYAGDSGLKERIEKLSVPLCDDKTKLDKETCRMISPGNLALTQSRLDSYVLCHFSYFCKYILKLKDNSPASFNSADIGTFIHHILESFVSRAELGKDIEALTDKELDELIDEIITDYMEKICRISPDFSGSRLSHLFARLRRSSRILCKNLASEFSQSKFRPAFYELPIRFPNDKEIAVEPLSVKLSDGSDAYLYGIADRVDIMEREGKFYVRVIDYKTGAKEFSREDISMGLNMQMLLYLFSIWKNGRNHKNALEFAKNSEIVPAGVLYFSAGVPTVTLDAEASPEEVEKMVSDKLKRNGLILDDPEILSAMDRDLSGLYIPIRQKKDGSYTKSDQLTTLEGFGELLSTMEATIKDIGNEIKRGNASIKPICDKEHNACAFCDMRPVCRATVNAK